MKKITDEIKNELVQSFNNGELIDYISDNALEIAKDDTGNIQEIRFTIGGPNVYLDFKERSGVVCAFKSLSDEGSFSAIPLETWEGMKDYLEEVFGEVA